MPQTDFNPAWWCRNPHFQTLWASVARIAPRPRYRREVLDLPDGDFLDLDWYGDISRNTVTVLVHGLCGSSRSSYIRGLAHRLDRDGSAVVVINLRGSGGRPNRRPRTYHSGHTEDLEYVLQTLSRRHPDKQFQCAGFSLGGNLLLKWLGENPDTTIVRAAAAVSVPLLLGEAARRMNTGFSRFYQAHLVTRLKQSVERRRALLAGRIEADAVYAARDFREFDDRVTAPVNGFSDADEYYSICSSRQYLRHIAVPTLIVQAVDDPFMTRAVIPEPRELSDSVTLEVYPTGGHVGFVEGPAPGFSRYWLDERLSAFFLSV